MKDSSRTALDGASVASDVVFAHRRYLSYAEIGETAKALCAVEKEPKATLGLRLLIALGEQAPAAAIGRVLSQFRKMDEERAEALRYAVFGFRAGRFLEAARVSLPLAEAAEAERVEAQARQKAKKKAKADGRAATQHAAE